MLLLKVTILNAYFLVRYFKSPSFISQNLVRPFTPAPDTFRGIRGHISHLKSIPVSYGLPWRPPSVCHQRARPVRLL